MTPIVIDNTNPTGADRRRYLDEAKSAGYAAHLYFFRSRLAECIERNDARSPSARVPLRALRATSSRLEVPSRDEGFELMRFVSLAPGGGFDVAEWKDDV